MRDDEILEWTRTERLGLADFLDGLDDHEWQAPSLCPGWTVHDVAAHMTLSTRMTLIVAVRAAVRARGSFDRMVADLARERAVRYGPSELVAAVAGDGGIGEARARRRAAGPTGRRAGARPGHRSAPGPGIRDAQGGAVAVVDHVLHSRFYGARARFGDATLVATDCVWTSGSGPHEIRGPLADLLLAATGRAAGTAGLAGPGSSGSGPAGDRPGRAARPAGQGLGRGDRRVRGLLRPAVRALGGIGGPGGHRRAAARRTGTGPVLRAFPGARHAGRAPARPEIIGMDLSAGMVRRARERAARHPRASVVHGDATTLHASWPRSCAAVVSVFGLQQLPEPDLAIRSWVTALRPGGRLLVVCWPDVTEPAGPFALMAEVVRAHAPSEDSAWERLLAPAAAAAGAVVERDEPVSHRMSHPDAAAFFDAHTHSAPLRPLATARGPAFVERLRAEFLCRSPAGEWHHRPSARHLLARATARDRSDRTDEQA